MPVQHRLLSAMRRSEAAQRRDSRTGLPVDEVPIYVAASVPEDNTPPWAEPKPDAVTLCAPDFEKVMADRYRSEIDPKTDFERGTALGAVAINQLQLPVATTRKS